MKVEWNHEKADTRIILWTSQETNDFVVVAKDTDVLVSLVRKDICLYSIKRNLFFKYDAEKYADIRKFCDYLGKDVCESILAFHAITGSTTNACFFVQAK